ncbi:HIT family protein [Candidatus Woesearchaeota archaeon]|nr:HIT family protein [Candidatus Woesearchaeota archaeon]
MDLTEDEIEQIKAAVQQLPLEEQETALRKELAKFSSDKIQQCPFCLMIEGKIRTVDVYEDDICKAVLEINPANPGHIILFPKTHNRSLDELSENEINILYKTAHKLAIILLKLSEGINIIISDGVASGKKFEHIIISIIPRFKDDNINIYWQGKPEKLEKLEKFAEKIKEKIPKEKKKKEEINEDELESYLVKPKHRIPN